MERKSSTTILNRIFRRWVELDEIHFDSYKITMVGMRGIGKTCLGIRFANGEFNENTPATIGDYIWTREVEIPDDVSVIVHILDTAGYRHPLDFIPTYFRNLHAVLIAFDCTNRRSFLELPEWFQHVAQNVDSNVCIFVVATKCDSKDRVVTAAEIKEFVANTNKEVFETSALTGLGVDNFFMTVVNTVHAVQSQLIEEYSSEEIVLQPETKRKCCGNIRSCCGLRRNPDYIEIGENK